MKTLRLVAPLVLSLLVSGASAQAQDAVVKRNVNLRTYADVDSTKIRTLQKSEEISLLEPDKFQNYYHVVTAASEEGWVWSPNIRIVFPADPAEVHNGCPLEGNAQSERGRQINQMKNRTEAPTSTDIDPVITLAAILQPSDDEDRWQESQAAVVTGFVVDVFPGGKETVNCGASALQHRDTHIELALNSSDTADNRRVIVEVTPRWRAFMADQGEDWSTSALDALEGQCAEFTGWMFWDAYHDDESENTTPGRPENWRATAWEIHPVTAIRAIPCPS